MCQSSGIANKSKRRLKFMKRPLLLLLLGGFVFGPECSAIFGEQPVDLANPLVGTAPLDNQDLIGNAPPPGEELYTGFVWPGPALPHRDVLLNPINKDLAETADNHGIRWSYTYPRRTMIGF